MRRGFWGVRGVIGFLAVLAVWGGCSGDRPSAPPDPSRNRAETAIAAVAQAGLLASTRVDMIETATGAYQDVAGGRVRVADASVRLEATSSAWLQVTAEAREAGVGRVHDRALVFTSAEPDTDVVIALTERGYEEHRVLASERASSSATYRLSASDDVADVVERHGRVEALDAHGRAVFHTRRGVARDAKGTERPVVVHIDADDTGWTLTTTVDARGLSYPVVVDPEWVFGASWPDEAVVALNSTWIRQNATVTGDVAVLDAAPGAVLTDSAEAVVGLGALVTGDVTADRIRIESGGEVTGDALSNALTNNGTLGGQALTPLTLPLSVTVPAMPVFDIDPGAADVTLLGHEDLTLAPGDYGTVKLKGGSAADPTVLTLSGGVYELEVLDVGDRSRVVCSAPCEIRIADKLMPGAHAFIGPASGMGLTAADIELYVAGVNGASGNLGATPKAATVGQDNTIEARVLIPNGTLLLKDGTTGEGTFVGRDVQVGLAATITAVTTPPSGEPDCVAHCELSVAAGCSAGPNEQAACEAACAEDLADAFCSAQHTALVLCSNAAAPASCDVSGTVVITGCESEQADADTCVSVCGAADDGDPCTNDLCDCTPGACDPATAITHPPAPAGASCDDDDVCNGADTCDGAGTCGPGTPLVIDDGNPCTVDACDAQTGATHTPEPAGTACEDSDICNGEESCDGAGTCAAGTPVDVDDGNPCTADSCDPVTGVSHTLVPAGTSCTDDDACNGDELCDAAGSCTPGAAPAVDDGNPCTADSCDPVSGVAHTPLAAGASCADASSRRRAEPSTTCTTV